MRRLWAFLLLLLFAASPALAETRSVHYAIWNVTGGDVRVLYMLPTKEMANLAEAGSAALNTNQVKDYVLAHLAVTRQGKACMVADQGQDLGLINTLALLPGLLRFEIVFQCGDATGLTLSDKTFADRVANHLGFGRVQVNNGGFVQHVFTAGAPDFALPVAVAGLQSDSLTRYSTLGIDHVVRSADILLFMLALLLVARSRGDYAILLSALAMGYGLAIPLAAFDITSARFGSGYGVNALLLILVAAAGVALGLSDSRRGALPIGVGALVLAVPAALLHGMAAGLAVLGAGLVAVSILFLPHRGLQRALFLLIVPLLFALLDGFTLPHDLEVLDLPAVQASPMLLGFALGTLVAEVALPVLLVGIWYLVPLIQKVAPPRGLLPDLAASVFLGSGVFWYSAWLYS